MKRSVVAWCVIVLATALGSGCGSDDEKDKQMEESPSSGGDGGMSMMPPPTTMDGGFVNAANCPAAAPMDDAQCIVGRLECRYDTTRCTCNQATQLDPPGTWDCRALPRVPMQSMCPMAEPAPGSMCSNIRGECMYGPRVCDCTDGNTWACWNPADCPMAAPAERAACPTVGMSCEYEQGRGDELECECGANGWDCGRQFCPPARPMVGAACETGRGTCMFADETCDCVGRAWSCWRPSDCPMPAPADDSACSINGLTCSYGGNARCGCNGRTWNCQGFPRGDAGVQRDGGTVDASGIDAAR